MAECRVKINTGKHSRDAIDNFRASQVNQMYSEITHKAYRQLVTIGDRPIETEAFDNHYKIIFRVHGINVIMVNSYLTGTTQYYVQDINSWLLGDTMRKIEQNMLKAIQEKRDWMQDNTCVVFSDHNGNPYMDATVYLHNNEIAIVLPDGTIQVIPETFKRWPTSTTRSRLNALGVNANIKNFKACIDGVELWWIQYNPKKVFTLA